MKPCKLHNLPLSLQGQSSWRAIALNSTLWVLIHAVCFDLSFMQCMLLTMVAVGCCPSNPALLCCSMHCSSIDITHIPGKYAGKTSLTRALMMSMKRKGMKRKGMFLSNGVSGAAAKRIAAYLPSWSRCCSQQTPAHRQTPHKLSLSSGQLLLLSCRVHS